MLRKENRVSRKEVGDIFKAGKMLYSNSFFLKYLIKKDGNPPKVSFTVSKTVSKKANKRNLLRRRGYIAIVGEFEGLPEGFLGVFVFNNKALINFGGRKTKKTDPILGLKSEIKQIMNKL